MKSVIAICLLIAVVGINANTLYLHGEQKERANRNRDACITESGVKPEIIEDAKKGIVSEDENLKKFTLCFFEKAGVVDHEGKLNIPVALAKLPEGADKVEAERLLNECKDQKGKDAADTAFEILKCYKSRTNSQTGTHFALLE